MWALLALGSAFFAGVTAIIAKIGIRSIDSDTATAIRTTIVLLFSWLIVYISGSASDLKNISGYTMLFLCLSGFSTGASWLCYFKALQIGDVNKVAAVDKSSTVLTMVMAMIFLRESVTPYGIVSIVLIGLGTYMMIERKNTSNSKTSWTWLIYASLSAIFASLTSILGKIGISDIDSNLGTAIRTIFVLFMAWMMVFIKGKAKKATAIDKKSMIFICLSGITTGLSWLCYFKALQTGPASIVVPIDKLSIVITVILSFIILHEKIHKIAIIGLISMVAGTLLLLI
jgi:transporter family protein